MIDIGEQQELGINRLLYKKKQSSENQGAVYMSVNENNLNRMSRQFNQSGEIITGTVITDCFFQTSGSVDRVEIAGNDVTFYDSTYTVGGVSKGDTSRIVWTRADRTEGTYFMEKRSSIEDENDNVLSLYATPPVDGDYNYIFIGRDGRGTSPRGVGIIVNSVDIKTTQDAFLANGIYTVEVSIDGETPLFPSFQTGDSRSIVSPSFSGVSTLISAHGGGIVGIAYGNAALLYLLDATTVTLGADMIPDANGAYDIGSPAMKIGTFYGSISACPLPTIPNALEVLEKIPKPSLVDDRGHYGHDRIYFDDLTFPEEVLYTNPKGVVDIEHNHMLGFLLKAVIELNDEVKTLREELNL